jgi:Family of unknown function (DUF5372)
LGSAIITHPYHPLRGRQFAVLKLRKVGDVQTLSLRASSGESLAVPLEWTDRGEPSPWTPLKEVPPFLYAPHLSALVVFLNSLSPQEERESQS